MSEQCWMPTGGKRCSAALAARPSLFIKTHAGAWPAGVRSPQQCDRPEGRAVYLERFIHSEIYKVHPEVKAVVHSHSPAVIAFGVTRVKFCPVFHLSSFLAGGAPGHLNVT
jgi:hypothetical protein